MRHAGSFRAPLGRSRRERIGPEDNQRCLPATRARECGPSARRTGATMRLSLRFIVPAAARARRVRVCGRAARRRADAALVRPRSRHRARACIAAAVQEPLTQLMTTGSEPRIRQFFNRMLQDERLYALGLCFDARTEPVATAQFPRALNCDDASRRTTSAARHLHPLGQRGCSTSRFAASTATTTRTRWLALVHDMSFVERRSEETRQLPVLLLHRARRVDRAHHRRHRADLVARLGARPARAAARRGPPAAVARPRPRPELRPIARDLRELIRDLERQYRPLDGSQRIWDQQALRATLRSELHGNDVIVVSNREPYIHVRTTERHRLQRPASGLVTALEPVMRACSGTWIAHGSGSRRPRDRRPPRPRRRAARASALPGPAHLAHARRRSDGYYCGFANEGLWPLCHIAHVRPTFRAERLRAVPRASTRKFADAVVAEAKTQGSRRPRAGLSLRAAAADDPRAPARRDDHHVLAHPVAESRGVRDLPVARRAARRPARQQHPRLPHAVPLQQLPRHRRSHARGARRPRDVHDLLPRRVDRGASLSDLDRVAAGAARDGEAGPRRAARRARAPRPAAPTTGSASASTASTTRRASSSASTRSRGCSSSSRAGSAASRFVQIAAPSRATIDDYRDYAARVHALAAEINDRYRGREVSADHPASPSITSRTRSTSTTARPTCASCRSLHDGMNLVAKEFVAARDDEQGVLILSQFAGASRELLGGAHRQSVRRRPMRGGAAPRAHDAAGRAARPHALHARRRARVQRLPLGGTHAARRGGDAPARPLPRGRDRSSRHG